MGDSTLINMGEKLRDARFVTPESTLLKALQDMKNKGELRECENLLILTLDKGKAGNEYNVSCRQAGMSMSECIALCEVGKTLFLTEMDY